MRRLLLVLCIFLLLGGGVFWYWYEQKRETVEQLREVAKKVADIDVMATVDADLSLKGIELSHGQEGQLHWKLKAKKAQYVQDSSQVKVQDPEIAYYFEGSDKMFTVTAANGIIEKTNESARLWPEVKGTYDNITIRADELEYSGKERALILRGNVTITGPNLSCQMPVLRYLLATNDIVADSGVVGEILVDSLDKKIKGELAP